MRTELKQAFQFKPDFLTVFICERNSVKQRLGFSVCGCCFFLTSIGKNMLSEIIKWVRFLHDKRIPDFSLREMFILKGPFIATYFLTSVLPVGHRQIYVISAEKGSLRSFVMWCSLIQYQLFSRNDMRVSKGSTL